MCLLQVLIYVEVEQTMLSKYTQCGEQQRQGEAGPCSRNRDLMGQRLHFQCSEERFNHKTRAKCTECSKPRKYRGGILCNNVPSQSRGPHIQCTEELFYHHSVPSAQQRLRDRCTECRTPRNYRGGILCSNIPGQSRGPHLQCNEESFHHHTVVPSAQHRFRDRCTECRTPRNYRDGTLCNNVTGQSRGPHFQCTEDAFHHHVILTVHYWYRARCTECCTPCSYQDGILCNSVPGQSRGPHLQCTEEPCWNTGRVPTMVQSLT